MLDQVPSSAANLSDQYVLVTGAIDAAEQELSLDLAFRLIDLMASLFEADALAAKNDAATVVMTSTAPYALMTRVKRATCHGRGSPTRPEKTTMPMPDVC